MTRLAYRFTTMRDHTAPMTLIQDILEELRPDLPADFRFGVLHDRWDDVIMTEFQTRGQAAGSWVNADAPPREVAEKLLRDLQAVLTNPDLFGTLPLDPRVKWQADHLRPLSRPHQLQHTV